MNRELVTIALGLALGAVACGASSRANRGVASTVASGTPGVVAGCAAPSVYFDQGSAELDDEDRASLRALAQCLQRREIDTLYVVGRTDPVGTPAFNLELGQQRAAAVATYLQGLGASSGYVVKSRGETGASSDEVLWPLARSATVTAATAR